RLPVKLKITINFSKQDLIYAPAEATWMSRPGKLLVASMNAGHQETLGLIANPGLVAGNSYEVRALIAAPTVEDLRNAGSAYPDWVTARYLQVPEKLEPQLKALAEKITAASATPFDQAQAITAYLRETIEYQTNLAEVPSSAQDPLLWVLFDYKKGFCVYYASAEVLLLRTLGIPARMAVGFAQGTYDPSRGRYIVTHLNAHAWPEVYFPGIGWVEFEPTGNQDPLTRPSAPRDADSSTSGLTNPSLTQRDDDLDNAAGFEPDEDATQTETTRTSANGWIKYLYFGLGLGLMGLLVFTSRRYAFTRKIPLFLISRYQKHGSAPPHWIAYWAYWTELNPAERTYQSLHLSAWWLGLKPPLSATPQARAAVLKKVLPEAVAEIDETLKQYQSVAFAARPADLKSARRAGWRILLKAWQARAFHYKEISKRRYNIRYE
ncbi:MAG: transglutaminase domain-containing protein, partial [Anaerolineales bacterium]|nr:transglutaminase domain-containing protein [Anaerolineales bacterium]